MGRGKVAVAAAAALLVGVSGCQLKGSGENLVAGKQAFHPAPDADVERTQQRIR